MLGGDDASPRAIQRVFAEHDLALGEHDFLAHSLFLALGVGEVDRAARRKIAIDRFVIDDLLKSIAVAKGHSQDQRRLPFAFGAKDFDRHRRVDVQEKLKSRARQTPVQTDGILGKQLEAAAVASASFSGGIAAIDDGDVQAAIAQCRRRLIIRQRMPGAKPVG